MKAAASLLSRFTGYIATNNLFKKESRLLLAVSGGLDSVVLCHLCHSAGFSFSIAHCNFGLRGAESDRDEAFVRQLGAQLDVPVAVAHFDTEAFAQEHKLSIQEAARKLRYDWFAELLQGEWSMVNGEWAIAEKDAVDKSGLLRHDYLLTAHHLDDNLETVLMNLFKGTGISGLRGMLPKTNSLVRPLLFARRAELAAYAKERGLQWVEDSSNAQTKYTRNFFRHEVVPLIEQRFPQALSNLADSLTRFAEVETLYHQAIDQHKKKLVEYKGEELHIPVLKLAKAVPLNTIIYELIKPFGFTAAQTGEVATLLQSETGKFVRSATHQVLRHRRWLVIAPLQSTQPSLIVIEKEDDRVPFENGILNLQLSGVPQKLQVAADTALLDLKEIRFPVILRRWRAGDYFYPLGMPKKKKVSRFLIDLKLSKSDKEKVWVLESGRRIAWVVGLRIDDRFKVKPSTQQVLKITTSPYPADKAPHRQ